MTSEPISVEELTGHYDFVRRLARSLVRDSATAEDVTQQTFAAALTNPPRTRAAVIGWLAGVVRNLSARSHRDRAARERRESAAARTEEIPSTAAVLEREETRRRLVAAVLALDAPYRSVVLLRYFEEAPPREIARRLGVPVETVRTRLKRALARLRTRMDRESDGRRDTWVAALLPFSGGALMATKTKLAIAAVVLLVLAGGTILMTSGPAGKTPPTREAAAPPSAPAPAAPVEPESADPAPATPATPEYAVRGRVVDQDGEGVAAAWVMNWGEGATEKTRTDSEGRFSLALAGPEEVRLCAMPPKGYRALTRLPWETLVSVRPPAGNVELSLFRPATATVRVRVVDGTTGEPVAHARIGVYDALPPGNGLASGEPGDIVVPFPGEGRSAVVVVRLVAPGAATGASREITLTAGEVVEVQLVSSPTTPEDAGPRVTGRVHDAEDHPIAGAFVYAGSQMRMRGDEPFKPFRIDRVKDAVKTGDDGRFELEAGEETVVTIWHPDYSPVTVPMAEAGQVELLPRATLGGRLADDAGRPLAGIVVALDRDRKATTDSDGRFEFEQVEAGVRGLLLSGRYLAVRIRPGEEAEVEIPAGLPEATVEFQAGGALFQVPEGSRPGGLLVGLDRVGGVHPLRVKPGDTSAKTEHVVPGRYLLLLSSGLATTVTIAGPRAVADFGAADLTVKGPPGTPIYVVPADTAADELVRLLAGRAVFLDIPASGEVRVDPLPAGRWRVGLDETSGRRTKGTKGKVVEVSGHGATVTLD